MPEFQVATGHWLGFNAVILLFLALDLGVLHREARVVRFREAMIWTGVWFTLALLFGAVLAGLLIDHWGRDQRAEFITGYIIELSLSMDNVFVIACIFSYFRIPSELQHRVLFWGILGALLMRGMMIWLGTELIQRFHAMLYVFGAFLLLTAVKMLFASEEGVHPERNPVLRLVQRFFPVAHELDGQRFVTLRGGRKVLTPLALVLVMVETTDLVFALDSIPAIFGVTQNSFIVYTSNVFAILGLRSLYFVLAGALAYFRFLKVGLSVVLGFIGLKMLLDAWVKIPTTISLITVAGILLISVLGSALAARLDQRAAAKAGGDRP
jgi:tellurite resistance protein TerC